MPMVHLVRSSLTLAIAGALMTPFACSVYTEDLLLEVTDGLTDDSPGSTSPDSGDTDDATDVDPLRPPDDGPSDGTGGNDGMTPVAPSPFTPETPDASSTGGLPTPPTGGSGSAPTETDVEPGDGSPTDPVGAPTDAPEDPEPDTDAEPEPEPEPDPDAPSDDPLIDDFDSRNARLNGGNREGFWFTDGSTEGQITAIADAFVRLDTGGAAAHIVASGFELPEDGGWAVFGVNFNEGATAPPAYIQAAQYDGIQFWACTAAASGTSELYVEIPTTDTSQEYDDSNENNHFRYLLQLDDIWTQYSVAWDDVEQTWGKTRPFVAEHIVGLQFSLLGEGFDIWIDNIEFTPADGSQPSSPEPSGPCPGLATTVVDAGAP